MWLTSSIFKFFSSYTSFEKLKNAKKTNTNNSENEKLNHIKRNENYIQEFTNYPKAIKTNILLEESNKYYISTTGKAFLKSNYEIKKLSPAFPFPKSIDGNRFNVGSTGYYGSPVWKTKEQILNETDKILEVIDFIEKNQNKV